MKTLQRLVAVILLVSHPLWATTYYVDNSCSNNGTGLATSCAGSPGGAGPFNSLANAQSGVTGDQHGNSLLLDSGETFRETYTINSGGVYGTLGGQFTVGSYGVGAQPIVSGADVISAWTTVVGEYIDISYFRHEYNGPAGWTNSSNSIEVIGGGGAGYDTNDSTNKAAGGGGGGYSEAVNVT